VLDDGPIVAGEPEAPPVQAAGASAEPPPEEPLENGTPVARPKAGSGSALFLGDAAGAFLLANEARYRALEAIGIRREDANIATAIGVLTVANAVYERAHRPKAPKAQTAVADLAIGVGTLRESIYGVAGPASRDTPLGGTLIALAILGGLLRPPLKRGAHEIRASSKRMTRTFRGRYGYLARLGHEN